MRIELPALYKDPRGPIQNILELADDKDPVRGLSTIMSRARTTRSNHWHREDWHYLYVLSGELHYWESPAEDGTQFLPSNYAQHPEVYRPGECVFTPAYMWHRTYFPVDTVLVSASRFGRSHAAHEADVVREPVVYR